ncbi:hypothetical protein ACQY0O_001622 [Thecaphora frezii]
MSLYAIVFTGKKTTHKLAVIRHRCQSKLMAAFRQAINSRVDAQAFEGVWVVHAYPQCYTCPTEGLVSEMNAALRHIAYKGRTNASRGRLNTSARNAGPRVSRAEDHMGRLRAGASETSDRGRRPRTSSSSHGPSRTTPLLITKFL